MTTKNDRKPPPNFVICGNSKRKPLPVDISITPVVVRKSTRKTASQIAVLYYFVFLLLVWFKKNFYFRRNVETVFFQR